jgi:hypothetical protein
MKRGEPAKLWTQQQSIAAAGMWQDLFVDVYGDDIAMAPKGAADRVWRRIAVAVGRTFESVYYRFDAFGPSFGANQSSSRKATPAALADMVARKEAERRRDITAEVFGDPAPGFSALDRRQRGMSR